MLADLIHYLAQPTAAAALAIEVALLDVRTPRPDIARRLSQASEHLATLQRTLHALGSACVAVRGGATGSPSAADLPDLLVGVLPGVDAARLPLVTAPGPLLREALRFLVRLLGAGAGGCSARLAADGAMLRIRIAGHGHRARVDTVWIRALRMSGVAIRQRISGTCRTITLDLPVRGGVLRHASFATAGTDP